MANTKISQLTANTNPNGGEELVYAYNNSNGKMSLNTMKTFANVGQQVALVSGVNIKTINNTSILGSGNIDVSGGGGGGWQPTELSGDANIWELSEGIYVTDYNLYYQTGMAVPFYLAGGATGRQMLFVIEETGGGKSFFVYNLGHKDSTNICRCGFGYSNSDYAGEFFRLRDWTATFEQYEPINIGQDFDVLDAAITQIVDDAHDNMSLRAGSSLYPGITYTLYVNSVRAGNTYDVTLGAGVTNPLNITLPTNSNKLCVITLFAKTVSTAIVTSCTMAN